MFSFTSEALPAELLEKILDDLYARDKLRLSIVNKEWNVYFNDCPWVWRKLDFGHLRREFDPGPFCVTSEVSSYLSKAKFNVRKLSINCVHRMSCNWDTLGLEHFAKLVDLDLADICNNMDSLLYLSKQLPSLKRLKLGGEFDLAIPMSFLQNSLTLESASFTFLRKTNTLFVSTGTISPNLKSLEFKVEVTDYNFLSRIQLLRFPTNIIEQAFNLERLNIQGTSSLDSIDYRYLTKLQKLGMSQCMPLMSLFMPPSIRNLDISMYNLVTIAKNNSLPELEALHVTDWRSLPPTRSVNDLVIAFECIGYKLRELSLRQEFWNMSTTTGLAEDLLRALIETGKIANLRTLEVELPDFPQNSTLDWIRAACPKLRELHLLVAGSSLHITKPSH